VLSKISKPSVLPKESVLRDKAEKKDMQVKLGEID